MEITFKSGSKNKILTRISSGGFEAYLADTNWKAKADTEQKAIDNLKFCLEPYLVGYVGADSNLR